MRLMSKSRVKPEGGRRGIMGVMLVILTILSGCGPWPIGSSENLMGRAVMVAEEPHTMEWDYGCANRLTPPPPPTGADVVAVEVATDVSSSGGRIWLGESTGDRPIVTITGATVFFHADGSQATLDQIGTGMCIEVVGRAGRPDEVVAERIVILSRVRSGPHVSRN